VALIYALFDLTQTPVETARPWMFVHHMVCPFTVQLSLVLITSLQRDGMLSWLWYTLAMGEIETHTLTIRSPAPKTNPDKVVFLLVID